MSNETEQTTFVIVNELGEYAYTYEGHAKRLEWVKSLHCAGMYTESDIKALKRQNMLPNVAYALPARATRKVQLVSADREPSLTGFLS